MIHIRILTVILLVFTLNVTPALIAAATKESTKKAPIKTETMKESIKEEEIIASFEIMIKKYQQFFSEPRLCYNKQKFSKSPTGFTYNAAKYMSFGKLSYDVKKTDSLISPYTGYCLMTLKIWTARKCGNIIGKDVTADIASALPEEVRQTFKRAAYYGFDTLEAAKQATLNESCFELERTEEVRFNFSFQGKKWVWKSAIRTKYNNSEIYIATALGEEGGVGIPLEDNKDWLILVEQ